MESSLKNDDVLLKNGNHFAIRGIPRGSQGRLSPLTVAPGSGRQGMISVQDRHG